MQRSNSSKRERVLGNRADGKTVGGFAGGVFNIWINESDFPLRKPFRAAFDVSPSSDIERAGGVSVMMIDDETSLECRALITRWG